MQLEQQVEPQIPEPPQFSPTGLEPKPKNHKKLALLTLAVIVIIGCSAGAYIQHNRSSKAKKEKAVAEQQAKMAQEQKQKSEKEIADALALKQQQEALKATPATTQTPQTDPAKMVPTDKDVTEIKKFLSGSCESSAPYNGPAITKAYLQTKSTNGALHYYNGYSQIPIGCQGDPGGYVSYMQRQSDKTWKQLLGAQDILGCSDTDQYKIPSQIAPTCTSASGDTIANKN